MSFFKEFKEDITQAVNELVETDDKNESPVVEEEVDSTDSMVVNTFDETEETEMDIVAPKEPVAVSSKEELEPGDEIVVSDEITEITKGTTIEGNISSDGSINLNGKVKGNIECNGKLIILGDVTGNSGAGEILTDNAKISGDVKSKASVKVGNGTVIIGNLYATSAVIAGAIKGDVDVKGPVILDGTAVVQGNIKSRSVQINNGAVVEGFCSQSYAEVDYERLFDDTFSK